MIKKNPKPFYILIIIIAVVFLILPALGLNPPHVRDSPAVFYHLPGSEPQILRGPGGVHPPRPQFITAWHRQYTASIFHICYAASCVPHVPALSFSIVNPVVRIGYEDIILSKG